MVAFPVCRRFGRELKLMRNLFARALLPAAILVAVACASSGARETGGGGISIYQKQVGKATRGDLARKSRLIFDRYRFTMAREDSSVSQQFLQSRWEGRFPLQDELDSGVVEVQTRLTVRARARGAGSRGVADTRVVQLTIENMVRMAPDATWRRGFMTPMFLAYAKRITEDLRSEILQGVRVF